MRHMRGLLFRVDFLFRFACSCSCSCRSDPRNRGRSLILNPGPKNVWALRNSCRCNGGSPQAPWRQGVTVHQEEALEMYHEPDGGKLTSRECDPPLYRDEDDGRASNEGDGPTRCPLDWAGPAPIPPAVRHSSTTAPVEGGASTAADLPVGVRAGDRVKAGSRASTLEGGNGRSPPSSTLRLEISDELGMCSCRSSPEAVAPSTLPAS